MRKEILAGFAGLSMLLLSAQSFSQSFACGNNHSLAVCADGTVKACGGGNSGELGAGSGVTSSLTGSQVSGLTGVIAVSAGDNNSLALKSDGTVWAWGSNNVGQLGNGSTQQNSFIPVKVSQLSGIIAITAGSAHCLALKNDGTVWVWGSNSLKQLGSAAGTQTFSNVPLQVKGIDHVIAIAGGGSHSLAVKNNGTVWGWGSAVNGQLGCGYISVSAKTIENPVLVVVDQGRSAAQPLGDVTAITAFGQYSFALKKDGTVWAWGSNEFGTLGIGSKGNFQRTAVQVYGLTNITMIAAGAAHTLALKKDGTVMSWGMNNNGDLGIGKTGTGRLAVLGIDYCWAPVPVIILTNVTAVYAGKNNESFASKSSTIYSWGYNSSGQLGNGNTIPSNNTPAPATAFCKLLQH